MKRRNDLGIVLAGMLLLGGSFVAGQSAFSGFMDLGSNNVSEGLYIHTAGLMGYEFDRYNLTAGMQLDIVGRNDRVLSGITMRASRVLMIKDFKSEIKGFFLWKGHGSFLKETNWGLWLDFDWPHFKMSLGSGFRSYSFTTEAISLNGFHKDDRIRENWNLLYSFGYKLKRPGGKWNTGIAISNMDYFSISQETNPVLKLDGSYRASTPLCIFMEGWYKSAGAFNLSVNYFGFFIRTGVRWVIA